MTTETDIQIANLRASLKGKAIGPDDPRYDDVRRVFFTGFDRRPEAIVRVGDASDVASVGLGRITLDGGVGFLVRKHGLTAEHHFKVL